jgi:hypothetical protein
MTRPALRATQHRQLPKPPSDDALAAARALAKLHARIDHDAEIARQSILAPAEAPAPEPKP